MAALAYPTAEYLIEDTSRSLDIHILMFPTTQVDDGDTITSQLSVVLDARWSPDGAPAPVGPSVERTGTGGRDLIIHTGAASTGNLIVMGLP